MTSQLHFEDAFAGVNVSLEDNVEGNINGDEIENMVEFMSALPCFPAFTGLSLYTELVLPNFSALKRGVAAAFPNLKALALRAPLDCISSTNLQDLGSFTALQHLCLDKSHFSASSLSDLCIRLPALRTLRVCHCPAISVADGNSLKVLKDRVFPLQVQVCECDAAGILA